MQNVDNQINEHENDGWTEAVNIEDRITGKTDTLLHPVDVRSHCGSSFCVAPGEGQLPLGLYQDINSEYLAFPTIYCGQKRPVNKQRVVPVFYSDICKWEMRCHDRRAGTSIPNLFFKVKKLQIKQIQDKVSLAMRKCSNIGKKTTVADVLSTDAFNNIVRLNEGFRVLRNIRGSPAYWENTKKDIFTMIRQLGIPTWFCSLSAADTKWNSLLRVLGEFLWKKTLSDDELANLNWMEKCELVKSDPVTCARYFQHRVEVFFPDSPERLYTPTGLYHRLFLSC